MASQQAGPALEEEETEDEATGNAIPDHHHHRRRHQETEPTKLLPPSPPPPPSTSMPEYRSISTVSQPPYAFKASNQGVGAPMAMAFSSSSSSSSCFTCSRDGETQTLHRLTEDGTVKRLCSLCVLSRHRGMYCSLCFLVYKHTGDIGDPGLWLTCSKCQRLCHLECARTRDISTDSLFFECRDCLTPKKGIPNRDSSNTDSNSNLNSNSNPTSNSDGDGGSMNKKASESLNPVSTIGEGCVITGGPNKKPKELLNPVSSPGGEACQPNKRPRLTVDLFQDVSPEEGLAAAQIVANIAIRQAKEAKDKARALAAASAKASARAKVALDAAHRAALEEARYRNELVSRPPPVSSALYPRKGLGVPPYPPSPMMRSEHLYPHAFPRPPPHDGLVAKRLNTTNNSSNVSARPGFTPTSYHHSRMKSVPATSASLNSTHPNMIMGNSATQKAGSQKIQVDQNHQTVVGSSSSSGRADPSSQVEIQHKSRVLLPGQAQIGGSNTGSKTNETKPRAVIPSNRLDSSSHVENQPPSVVTLPDQAHISDMAVKANDTNSSDQVASGTSQTQISGSDLVTCSAGHPTIDCSFSATCPVTNTMVTDTLGELKPLSPSSAHAVDDFVDMGLLLAEECEKIKQNGIAEVSVVSDQSDLVSGKADVERDKEPLIHLQSEKESVDKESDKYDGDDPADEQGKCVHDDSAALATKVH